MSYPSGSSDLEILLLGSSREEVFVIFCLVAPAVEQEEQEARCWHLYSCHPELPPIPAGWRTCSLGNVPDVAYLTFCFSVISLKREKACNILHLKGNH